jgi:hypothetical protein
MVPENVRENIRRYRERHKALGLCSWCSNPVLPGRGYCGECQQRYHDAYLLRMGPRTCQDCGVEIPRVFGQKAAHWCPGCKAARKSAQRKALWQRLKADPRYQESNRKSSLAFQHRMKAAGRCCQCGTLRDIPGVLCGTCREIRTGRKPWEPGRAGRKPIYQPYPHSTSEQRNRGGEARARTIRLEAALREEGK